MGALLHDAFAAFGDADAWRRALRAFATGVVSVAGLPSGEQPMAVGVVDDFVRWTWSMHLSLRYCDVFAPAVVGYYCDVRCRALSEASRAHRRDVLGRVAAEVRWGPQPRLVIPPASPATPYSPAEILELVSWARSYTTVTATKDAHTLLALGLGAGLTAAEIIALREGDLLRHEGGVDVRVRGATARTVPMLHATHLLLPTRSDDATPFLFRAGRQRETVNAITNFTARGAGARPTVQRMRATWIVHHLRAATPLHLLLDAAGLASPAGLTRFLPHATQDAADASRRLLRYAVVPDDSDGA